MALAEASSRSVAHGRRMWADVGEGSVGETVGVGPVVMEVESCAVVDEVELAVPVEEIGVAGVRSTLRMKASNQTAREAI